MIKRKKMNRYQWAVWLILWAAIGTPLRMLQAGETVLEGQPHPPPESFPHADMTFTQLEQQVTDMLKAKNLEGAIHLWRELDPQKEAKSSLHRRLLRELQHNEDLYVHAGKTGWHIELLLSLPLLGEGLYASGRAAFEATSRLNGASDILAGLVKADVEWNAEQERLLLGMAVGAFTQTYMWKEIRELEKRIGQADMEGSKQFPRLQVYPQLGAALMEGGDTEKGMAMFIHGLNSHFYDPGKELNVMVNHEGFLEALYKRVKENRHEMRLNALNRRRPSSSVRVGRPEVHIEAIIQYILHSPDLDLGSQVVKSGLFDLFTPEKQLGFVQNYLAETLPPEKRLQRVWLLEQMEEKHPDLASSWLGIRLTWYKQGEEFSEELFRKQIEVAMSRPAAISTDWTANLRKQINKRDPLETLLLPFWRELMLHPEVQEQVKIHVWQEYALYLDRFVRKQDRIDQNMSEVIYPALRENRLPLSALARLTSFIVKTKQLNGFIEVLVSFPEEDVHAKLFLEMGRMISKKRPQGIELVRKAYEVHPKHKQIRDTLITMLTEQNLHDEVLEVSREAFGLSEDRVETLSQLLVLVEADQIQNWAKWQDMSRKGKTLRGLRISEEVFRVLAKQKKWADAEAFFADGWHTAQHPWKDQRTECEYLLIGTEMYIQLNKPQEWATWFFRALDRKMITQEEFLVMLQQLGMSHEHWGETVEPSLLEWPSRLKQRGAWTIRHKHLFDEHNHESPEEQGEPL